MFIETGPAPNNSAQPWEGGGGHLRLHTRHHVLLQHVIVLLLDRRPKVAHLRQPALNVKGTVQVLTLGEKY